MPCNPLTVPAVWPCCDDLASALAITFVNPVPGQPGWLAYGTDFETTSTGGPEIRFWPIRFCPFCGTALPDPTQVRARPPGPARHDEA